MTTTFETLGLCPRLLQTVAELGYVQPTPIQAGAIPVLLAGHDVLGQAQTGTGKTAAFALPMLQHLPMEEPGVQGLVLAPTRELAMQVADAIYRYGHRLGGRVLPVYGGQPYARQQRRLAQGVPIVVGTPGRLRDLLQQGALDLQHVRYVVLDEADAMLQMGFIDDVEALLGATPAARQTALFSATLSSEIRRLAGRYMRSPLTIAMSDEARTVPQTTQRYYLLHEASKVAALSLLLEAEDIKSALIFTRTRVGTAELAETLAGRGYPAEALHGDLTQTARETVLRRFRTGRITLLVATDVGARGLDIADVSHVINYDMPFDVTDYVHRIGRTGRAGRAGIALTLVTPSERQRLRAIETFTGQPITHATLPSPAEVQARREVRFKQRLDALLAEGNLSRELTLVTELAAEADGDVARLAAAAIRLARAAEYQRPIEGVRDLTPFPARSDTRRPQPHGRPTHRAAAHAHRPEPSRGPRRPASRHGDRVRYPRTIASTHRGGEGTLAGTMSE
jgi:ATP-dependent RNA helicase DeaD